jgi:carboxylate-amine ligase
MLTLGVEEELLLLGPTGEVAPAAPEVLRLARGRGGRGRMHPELMSFQVETASGICRTLRELEDDLTGLRAAITEAAGTLGVRVVATGVPPFGHPGPGMLTDDVRYRAMVARWPAATASAVTCACHVHVGIDDRALAVQVLGRLRPWLPTLLAITVNSPLADGIDTGWGSNRYRRQLAWPTFRPPTAHRDPESYDRQLASLVRRGVALDTRSVYWLARLSPRYPTIEVRVADTCLTAGDSVVFAGIVRALVATLADDVRSARVSAPAPGPRTTALRAQLLSAAHHGLAPAIVRPGAAGGSRAGGVLAGGVLGALVEVIMPSLEATGDLAVVLPGLQRLERLRTGADQQRALRAAAPSRAAFVSALAEPARSDAATGPTSVRPPDEQVVLQ